MEPPIRVSNIFIAVNREIRRQIGEHEEEHHGLPPRRTAPITAIPYADWHLTDEQIARAIELQIEGATLEDIALALDAPALVIVREMHSYRPPYSDYLRRLAQS